MPTRDAGIGRTSPRGGCAKNDLVSVPNAMVLFLIGSAQG